MSAPAVHQVPVWPPTMMPNIRSSLVFKCVLPRHCAQTLHSWASEELAGRCSVAPAGALLSTEDNQEEQCKQVEQSDQSQHRRHPTPCLPRPVPNQQPGETSGHLTHLQPILKRFCCDITKVGGATNQRSPCPLKCLLLLCVVLECYNK